MTSTITNIGSMADASPFRVATTGEIYRPVERCSKFFVDQL
jgi:hypothetical protein